MIHIDPRAGLKCVNDPGIPGTFFCQIPYTQASFGTLYCNKFYFFHHFQDLSHQNIHRIVWRTYTILQNKRMRRCEVALPPIIFERLKLPQQIIYRRKENLSESPNHQKYWENILVSQFYEQFSRNRRNLGHFRKFEKISNSKNTNILYIILKREIWRFQICNLFREKFKFRGFTKAFTNFAKYIIAFIFAKLKYFAKQIIHLESPDHVLQNDV